MKIRRTLHLLLAYASLMISNPSLALGQADGEVIAHLFEWRWPDVALECENFLGPKGYTAVQVSPPNEHAVVNGRPWYERYQPVSYKLESRSGNETEFVDMVIRCRRAGVKIIVDTVINHMVGSENNHLHQFGTAGTRWSQFNYPGTYSGWDFHYCGRYGDNIIRNYNDRWEVQNCQLATLADLKTESNYVRDRIASYFNKLIDIGVGGFRVDGAKHIPAHDMEEIFNRVHGNPYVFHEVLDYGSEPIKGHEYYNTGDVTEFRYSAELNRMFKYEPIKHLKTFGQSWGLRESKRALVFVDNHDSQRGHGAGGDPLTFKDQSLYVLANVFMLAHPYGNARVMSSYQFNDGSQGPPSHPSGRTKRVWTNGQANCYGEWICEHRWLAIANMVQFRKVSNGRPMTNWWDNGNRQIAFGRASRGFVVINREGSSLHRTFQTGLAQGWYCNVTAGNAENGQCSGDSVYVDDAGRAEIKVMPMASVAIHVGAKVSDSAH